jgi:hypothetical protein
VGGIQFAQAQDQALRRPASLQEFRQPDLHNQKAAAFQPLGQLATDFV